MIYVKQYGVQRSGTNWLAALIERNCRGVTVLGGKTLGHKHCAPVPWGGCSPPDLHEALEQGRVRAIVSAKDPYGIFWSLLMRYQIPVESASSRLAADAALSIGSLHRAWGALSPAVVRYEDLIRDPIAAVASLGFPLVDQPADIPTRIESGGRHTEIVHDRAFWLERRYMDELPPRVISAITRNMDWDAVPYEPVAI